MELQWRAERGFNLKTLSSCECSGWAVGDGWKESDGCSRIEFFPLSLSSLSHCTASLLFSFSSSSFIHSLQLQFASYRIALTRPNRRILQEERRTGGLFVVATTGLTSSLLFL